MWYYVEGSQRVGPHSTEEIQTLINNGTLQPHTLVWKAGMQTWAKAQDSELASLFNHQPPATAVPTATVPAAPASFGAAATQQQPSYSHTQNVQQVPYEPSSFRTLWLWFAWLIGAGIPLCLILIGLIPVIAGGIISLILLYRFWNIIQDGQARTTPGKAVGFLFIPFFNLYWYFVSHVGLAQDTNAYLEARNIQAPRINEGLVLAYYILFLCSMIPYLGILCSLANIVIWIMIFRQFAVAATHITEYKRSHAASSNQTY